MFLQVNTIGHIAEAVGEGEWEGEDQREAGSRKTKEVGASAE